MTICKEPTISGSVSFPTLTGAPPLVIAHRGASGYFPEHTVQSYEKAIELGADFIEPDLVATKDGILIARHEPWLADTTDIASHGKFVDRKTTRFIDGQERSDWFASDFTLEEIKMLRAKQSFAHRDQSFNSKFQIPTLNEIIELTKQSSFATGRMVGIYPETKHPTYHQEIGLSLEDRLLKALAAEGWTEQDSPVIVQSFETSNLKHMRAHSNIRLLQLIGGADEHPYDLTLAGDQRNHLTLVTNGLDEIASYANGIGAPKKFLLGQAEIDGLTASNAIARTHGKNLFIHAYTFRNEPKFQVTLSGGNPIAEYKAVYAMGIDGVFSDFPDTAITARDSYATELAHAGS